MVTAIVDHLKQNAARHPARVALFHEDRRITFGELWNRIVSAACHLSACGVAAGDRVMLAAPSTPAYVYGYFGTHLIGATTVPVDPNLAVARRDDLIQRTKPAVVFGTDAHAAPAAPCPVRSISEFDHLPAQQRNFASPAPESMADLIFTTGTTGRPKGVRLTHGNLATAAAHINAVFGTTVDDVDVVPVPLYHAFGLGRLRCVLAAGGGVALVHGFRLPGEIFTALEHYKATGLIGVPSGFAILLRFGERGLAPFANRLRYIEIGSAPMPLEHKLALMKFLPRSALFMHYGLTEAARSGFIEFHRDREHLHTIGKPAPGVRAEIRSDDGAVCKRGEPGVLWIGGRHVSPGYWDDDSLTAATFIDDWVRTGDMAQIDEDGYIQLLGRLDDVINVGGIKVAPDEVEGVLVAHPAIADAGCIAMPDPRGIAGQVVRAFVVAAASQPRPTDDELSRWAAQQLEPYKVPVSYEWLTVLPRTESGKLQRATLRKATPTTR